MISYLVCDQDGLVFYDSSLADAHFTANSTHTSHLGWGGPTCVPSNYVSGSSLSQYDTDPSSPTVGQIWIKNNGAAGAAGQAMGPLGLTYSQEEVETYDLSIYTQQNKIIRMRLS